MKDVTDRVRSSTSISPGVELLWDSIRASVILFLNGEPSAFYPLEFPANSEDDAVFGGVELVSGRGTRL